MAPAKGGGGAAACLQSYLSADITRRPFSGNPNENCIEDNMEQLLLYEES